ncbi:MAG TPA: ATP-binding protein [Candidatus Dormibacteraeota bacterium]|nr:ATP-binding protein [Candidatus Dormibacteraeota bacterium]
MIHRPPGESYEPDRGLGGLFQRIFPPPLGDSRFWGVQALVFLIAFLFWGFGQANHLPIDVPSYVVLCLFVFPVVYAALNFGLAGSLATAAWAVLLSIPFVIAQADGGRYLWADLPQFAIVIFVALFVGDRVEREVNARQRAERTQAALRQLFETSPAPTILLSEQGRLLEANAAALRLFGRSDDNRLPTTLAELVGSEVAHDIVAQQAPSIQLPSPEGDQRFLRPITAPWAASPHNAMQVMFFDVSEEQRRVDRADAYAAWVLRGQEEERQRIAKELHDEPVQTLVHLCRMLDRLGEEAKGETARRQIAEVRELATSIMEDLRRTSKGLRPPSLDDLGLGASVRRLATDLEQRMPIKARLRVSGQPVRLGADVELGLFRIAQEAMRNVERHSKASQVSISLSYSRRAVRLRIQDDGTGFDVDTDWTRTGSLGLIGMQERASLLGGELEVRSEVGTGTTVRATVPVTALDERELSPAAGPIDSDRR